jgi:type 1 glutamine amidotransferase
MSRARRPAAEPVTRPTVTMRTRLPIALAALAGLAALGTARAQDITSTVPDADKEKIAAAAPADAPAEPAKERKLLVFSKTVGFRHSSIPHGVQALKALGEKSGAFSIEHSEDESVFAADNLARFDAIVMLNTTGEVFEDEELKKAFSDFVKGGKGLVGIHSASDTFYKWAEYGDMIGGYFDGHPWHEEVHLKIEDPDHACNKCFGGSKFVIADEIYQYKPEPYSRSKLRVLMSLDPDGTDMKKNGMKRADGDYAVGWVQRYGDGRVFYSNLGHREATYWNPKVLAHFLAGIQFAVGDLEADTTPSAPAAKP